MDKKKISSDELISLDGFVKEFPIKIDLAYARADNDLFRQRIYRKDASLRLFASLARVVLQASERVFDRHKYSCILYDGLRTIDAQRCMLQTKRVQDNPHWLQSPALLSVPGSGAHPRGMAIDMALLDSDGNLIDMGTPFDYLAERPDKDHNPAHRSYVNLDEGVAINRRVLTDAMMAAAHDLNVDLVPLSVEWWDFRLPADQYMQFHPISEQDLPDHMRLLD